MNRIASMILDDGRMSLQVQIYAPDGGAMTFSIV
jgi:hypothetical protein